MEGFAKPAIAKNLPLFTLMAPQDLLVFFRNNFHKSSTLTCSEQGVNFPVRPQVFVGTFENWGRAGVMGKPTPTRARPFRVLDFGMDERLYVTIASNMGRGVFTKGMIEKDENLNSFYTINLPSSELGAMAGGTLSHYWFEDDSNNSAFITLGYITLINHSVKPNLDRRWFTVDGDEIVQLFALRKIEPGEQLFFDYRFEGKPTDPSWANGG